MEVRVVLHEGVLVCSACGIIQADPEETVRYAGYNHLLEAHRDLLVGAHGEVAVKRTETQR